MKNIKIIVLTVLIIIMVSLCNFNTVFAVEESANIEDGTYVIKSALDENYVFDIQASSMSNGGNLELWNNNHTNNQKFIIKSLGKGIYGISPVHSGKYLDVQGSSKSNGANVDQWNFHGGQNQQWIIKNAGNGYYNIISKCNGLYMDIPKSNAKNGANVHMWQNNGSKNQMFKLEKIVDIKGEKTIENGTYSIRTALNENFVLDIQGSNQSNGGNIELWNNNKTDNQKFKVTYLNNGTYSISAVHSGKYVEVQGSSIEQGANVDQWGYHGGPNQQWIIKDAGNGYYNIISKCNGLYMDIPKSEAKSGANVHVWGKNNSKNQLFKLENSENTATLQTGTYLIQSAINNNYGLDVPGSSKNNYVDIKIWTSSSSANQKFYVKDLGNGYYTIKAQHSGKYLETDTSSNRVYQNKSNSSDEQQWIIKDVGNGYFNIISKSNNLCIGAASATNGQIVKMYKNNNSKGVKFKFVIPTPLKGSQTISNGTYSISTALNKNLVLDIPHSSTENGELLEIWKNGSTANQKFDVKYTGNGYYTIKAMHSGKAIEVADGNKKLNAAIQQNASNSSNEQQWIIKDAGNGYYYIISKCSELCMDVTDSNAVNGTKLQTNTPNETNAQKFKFTNLSYIIDINQSKYPSYAESLEKLKASHPNWKFKFLYTGLNFSDAVYGESRVHSRNLIPTSYAGEWICSSCGTKLYDSGWYCASEKAIAYYLDPRNYLDEENIFQFLDVNQYDSNSCTLDGIKQKVSGTFLANYANDINTACKNTNVNPYYIISRVLQEQGTGGTTIGKGMDGGDGKTYYNPFNIGATGNGYTQIYNNALAKAKANGWDSMEKALEGGIYFCKVNWLENYQNTLYQNKFDIDSQNGTNLYEHQYMQNLMGAYSEARTLRSMYNNTGKIDSNFTFIIPLYENMDASKSARPNSDSEMYPMNVQITGNDVRLREKASTDSNILATLSKGTVLLSVQRGINSNWQMVITSNGTIGYISGTYLKQIDDVRTCNYTKTVRTQDGIGCNIRYGPGLNAPRMTAIADGISVTVIDDSTYKNIDGYNWYRIVLSDGRQAFMPGNYLK